MSATTRLQEIFSQLAANGVCDSTDVINALAELTTLTSDVTTLQAPVTATTTELANVADAINTTGKAVGKMVFNTTTGVPVWADSAAAAGTWSGADGVVDHSPA